MNVEVRTTAPRRLVRMALTPLTCMERVRGRKRLALAGLYTLIVAVVGVLVWREAGLRGLPNIGEPFDVRKHGTITMPDDRNAWVLYRKAAGQFQRADPQRVASRPRAWSETDWSKADPAVKSWVEENRPALETWLAGTERPEALSMQPKDFRIDTPLHGMDEVRPLGQLALLEGSRREQAGDLDGAWTMYRAALRQSRHIGMHGVLVARLVASSMLRKARDRIVPWIGHPGMTAPLLRRARQDLEVCAAMSPPISDAVRSEFFSLDGALDVIQADPKRWARYRGDDPGGWYDQFPTLVRAQFFLRHEPERSRRVLRLLVASILSQCDRPAAQRAKLLDPELTLYAHDSATPEAVRRIRPEKLREWFQSSELLRVYPALGRTLGEADGDAAVFDLVRLEMALRQHAFDHGAPPKSYGELVGPYLKALPLGFEPGDAVSRSEESPPGEKPQ
jgi:hypothetical protein